MKKLLGLTAAALVAMSLFVGCENPLDPNSDSITLGNVADMSASNSQTVVVTYDASAIPTMTVTLTPASQGVTASIQTPTAKSGDIDLTITASSAAVTGTYTVSVEMDNDGVTTTKTATFAVTGSSVTVDSLVEATQTLGSSANPADGTIDLDAGTLYGSTDVNASNVGSLDLTYSNGSSVDRFYLPQAAKFGTNSNTSIKTTAAGFNYTSTWPTSGYATSVGICEITAAQYNAAVTVDDATALYVTANAVVYAPVTTTSAFAVKTSAGAVVLVKVTSISAAGTTGAVTFKYAK